MGCSEEIFFCLRCRRRPTFDAHAAFDARERTRARGTRVRRLSRTNARALASSSRRLRDHRATAENARERGRAARASVLRSRLRVKSPPYPRARDRVASLRDRAARRPRRARATGEHDALRLHENLGVAATQIRDLDASTMSQSVRGKGGSTIHDANVDSDLSSTLTSGAIATTTGRVDEYQARVRARFPSSRLLPAPRLDAARARPRGERRRARARSSPERSPLPR